MKKQLAILVLALLPVAVFASPNEANGAPFCKHAERLSKQLGLNDDQKNKVEAIFKAQKEKFHALHEETETNLKAVLTSEQASKFEQLKEQRKSVRAANRAKRQHEAATATPVAPAAPASEPVAIPVK